MVKKLAADPDATRLAQLSGAEQAEAAADLLTVKTRRDTLRAALAVLRSSALERTRPALLALFAHYGRNGGAHDFGAYVRGDLLRTVRPLLRGEDLPLLAAAASTYEFPPPAFAEEAALLRSSALVALADLDDQIAIYHAVRLLVDEHTNPMSGEPAITAVQTLASLGEIMPLYQFVMDKRHANLPEVVGECLRALSTIPVALLPHLVATVGASAAPVVLIGLADLLLGHADAPQQAASLWHILQRPLPEVQRYVVAAIVAAGNEPLLQGVLHELQGTRDVELRAVAREALQLVAGRPAVQATFAAWDDDPIFISAAHARRKR